MKILITGVTGYLGLELSKYLSNLGYEVYGVSRGRIQSNGFKSYVVSQYSKSELEKVFIDIGNIDIVIHLAASLKYFGPKKELIESNLIVTKDLFELSRVHKVKKFIYASSVEADNFSDRGGLFGKLIRSQFTNYGASKKITEEYLIDKANTTNISVYCLRIGSIFSGERYTFISQIFESLVNKTRFHYQLPIVGKYEILPISMLDILRYINELIHKNYESDKVYNLHYPAITINEIINLLRERFEIKEYVQPSFKIKVFIYTYLFHQFNKIRAGYGDFTSYLLASGVFVRRKRILNPDQIGEIELNKSRRDEFIKKSAEENLSNNIFFY